MANNAELSQLIEDELKKQGYYDGHSKLRKQDDRDRDEEKALMGALRVEARVKEHQHQKTILTMKRSICIGGGLLVVVILWVVLALKSKSANQAGKGGPSVVVVTSRPDAIFSPPPSSQSNDPASTPVDLAETGKTSSTDNTSPASHPPPPASKTPTQSDSSGAEEDNETDFGDFNWSFPPISIGQLMDGEAEDYDYPELTEEEIEDEDFKYEDYIDEYMVGDDYDAPFSDDDDEGGR